MIPRVIHYTWFSAEEYPDKIRRCIESWRRMMPGWRLRLWDMDAIRDIDSEFLHEAIAMRKWAFAADVVRLWAVARHGGVYLDTDVMAYRPFDDLLGNRAFIGKENSWHLSGRDTEVYLTAHCFGAEPHHPFFERCLSYYNGRHFVTSDDLSLPVPLRCDMTIAPYIYAEIAKTMGYDPSALRKHMPGVIGDDVKIYPAECFDPQYPTHESYCRHMAVGAWREQMSSEPDYTLKYKIQWRIWAIAKKVLAMFNRELIEIN